MEKIKILAKQNSNKLKYLLVIGAIIGGINTLCRADYNLILYLYMYYIWHYMNNQKESQIQEKVSSFFFAFYSLIIDIIWCIFWGRKWNSLKKDSESTIHSIVIFLSWIGIILKIIISIMIGVLDWENIKSSLPEKLQEKVNNGNFQPFNEENNNV
jgi:hypothetical protein